MTGPDSAGKEKKQEAGLPITGSALVVLILAGFGLVVLYSTSAWNGQVKFADPAYYLKKQLSGHSPWGWRPCMRYPVSTYRMVEKSGSPGLSDFPGSAGSRAVLRR